MTREKYFKCLQLNSSRRLIFIVCFLAVCTHVFGQKRIGIKKDKYQWLSFKWHGDRVSGRYFDKLAIMLPVKINDLKGNFVAQFDLGANESVLYGNALKNYFPSQEYLYTLLDTTQKGISDAGIVSYPSKGMNLSVGVYPEKKFYFLENYGDEIPKDSLLSPSEKHMGTIGANFTTDKVLIMDLPNHKICILDTMDNYWASRASFVDCRVMKNRIQLPLKINGKTEWIMFDTGASIFPLFTNKALWDTMVDLKEKPDTLQVNSWGEKVVCYGATIVSDVYLGDHKLHKAKAWFTENKRLLDFYRDEGTTGTTGNAYFFNDIIVIDFKNKKFGVVK